MKHHILVVLASLFLAAGTVQAQSLGLVADIPFDFVVGKTTLHAGKYTISPISMSGSTILLRSSDLKESMFITPCLCASEKGNHESKLVFHVYGNHYFLSQIWTQGNDVGWELPRNHREVEEARAAQLKQLAIMASLARAR
jgi:hypothetical protein